MLWIRIGCFLVIVGGADAGDGIIDGAVGSNSGGNCCEWLGISCFSCTGSVIIRAVSVVCMAEIWVTGFSSWFFNNSNSFELTLVFFHRCIILLMI